MKKLSIWLLAAVSLIVLAGCATSEKEVKQSNPTSLQTTFSDKGISLPQSISKSPAGYITPEVAKAVAFSHAKIQSAEAYKIELELKADAVPHYDLSFKAGNITYEYEIHAQTAEIIEKEHVNRARGVFPASMITQEEAKSLVFAHAGVQERSINDFEIEINKDNAKVVYEIEFHSGAYEYEYEIDAESGAILNFSRNR